MMKNYHKPVLLDEAIQNLELKNRGIYVDATLGGGGHTKALLQSNDTIRVVSFDQDEEAIEHAEPLVQKYNGRLTLIHDNFKHIWTQLALLRIKKIDGILFDLGVSSHQIDVPERGFSFMVEGDLDMRMNGNETITAYQVVNEFEEQKLRDIFRTYGEEREAARIARNIVQERENRPIKTTLQLAEIIDYATISHQKMKAKARIFQALRIYINSELEVLQAALRDAIRLLKPSGRIAVISYHSLEDRIVKHFFREEEKDCVCPDSFLQCVCKKISTVQVVTKKPIVPSNREMNENSRARSAKMRVAEKKGVYDE